VNGPSLDDRITDDKFCIAFDVTDAGEDAKESLKGFFSSTGASEMNVKTI
jgi:hypothetical protein